MGGNAFQLPGTERPRRQRAAFRLPGTERPRPAALATGRLPWYLLRKVVRDLDAPGYHAGPGATGGRGAGRPFGQQ